MLASNDTYSDKKKRENDSRAREKRRRGRTSERDKNRACTAAMMSVAPAKPLNKNGSGQKAAAASAAFEHNGQTSKSVWEYYKLQLVVSKRCKS